MNLVPGVELVLDQARELVSAEAEAEPGCLSRNP